MADTPSRAIENIAMFVLVRLRNGSLYLYMYGFLRVTWFRENLIPLGFSVRH